MEKTLTAAIASEGYELIRSHPYHPKLKHGFIASQREGMEIFRGIDPDKPLIVAGEGWSFIQPFNADRNGQAAFLALQLSK